jgi:hypothetical protein
MSPLPSRIALFPGVHGASGYWADGRVRTENKCGGVRIICFKNQKANEKLVLTAKSIAEECVLNHISLLAWHGMSIPMRCKPSQG